MTLALVATAAELANTITRAGATPDDVQHLIAAVTDQAREEIRDRHLREPILHTCITPTCLRQFDMNARMSGRSPARPEWSGNNWRQLRGSAIHPADGYVCPDHADLLIAHMARRIEPYTRGRINVRCTCGQWSTSGLGITWHGAARGLWEQHLLEEMGILG